MTSPLLRARDVAKAPPRLRGDGVRAGEDGEAPSTAFQAWEGKRNTVRFTSAAVERFIAEHTGEAAR